jgi:integrase
MDSAIKVLRKALDTVCNQDAQIIRAFSRATIHSLRNTFCTRMFSLGMSDAQVQKLMGHSTNTMTKKYDGGAVGDVASMAYAKLDSRLSQPPGMWLVLSQN